MLAGVFRHVKIEEGGQMDIIYTDFEKAFDKVPHKRLLSKLKSYGISKELINFFLDGLKGSLRVDVTSTSKS